MKNDEWRMRLKRAIERSGKSNRAVSLQSGNGAGYIHSILSEGKDPKISNLISVCDVLNVDAVYILHGIEATPAQMRLLRLFQENPGRVDAILHLLDEGERA